MLPPVDTHVHLLAGLDDGPRDMTEAVAMAKMLVADGVRMATALAHQNDHYPENTAAKLRTAAAELSAALKAENVPLTVYPTGEVMASPDLLEKYDAGSLLTYADKGKFLLVEMPHTLFVDLAPIAMGLRQRGVRIVVAHAERYPELMSGGALVEQWIAAGCLIQVTAQEIAEPTIADKKVLHDWIRRGIVHMLGTDGHRVDMRPPRMKAGVAALHALAGPGVGDRISHIYASSIMQGRPINAPPPVQVKKSWFGRMLGG
jgi:protein-tyrosine phosphatase